MQLGNGRDAFDRRAQTRLRNRLGWILVVGWTSALGVPIRGQEPPRASGHDSLAHRVEVVLAAPGFQNGHWGVLVVDRKTGQTIYERNADQLFAPASVTKLFSTAAALVELGPNHRFQTPLVRRGEVDLKGTLHGDVILIAQGDLCMGGRTGPDGTLVFNVPLDAPKPHRSISEATAAAGRLLGKLCEVLYLDSGDNVAPAAQAVAPTRNRSGSAR